MKLKPRQQPITFAAIILSINLLAMVPSLHAAETDADPWSKISKRLVIGNVTLQLRNQEIHVTGINWNETLAWPMPSVSEYVCAVGNPFAQPMLQDGFVQNDKHWRVLQGYDDFKASAFPRFAFFANRPTTIGLLTGHAAANGGSVQQLFLVDVETGIHVLIPLDEGAMPQWLDRTNHPPAFATWRRSNDTAGADLRVGQAYRFTNGAYHRDLALEHQLLAAGFHKSQLTAAQLQEIRSAGTDFLATEFSGQGRPLDNYIYYGTRSGNQQAVDKLIATLPAELRRRASKRRASFTAEADQIRGSECEAAPIAPPANAAGGQAADSPVPWRVLAGDTGLAIARRHGITWAQLQAANPKTDWKRLRIGQTLMLPDTGWRWETSPATNFVVVHPQLGLRAELTSHVGMPRILSWQRERDNLWSLTYFAGAPGTKYTFDIIRKAVFNVRTRELLADKDFHYENLNGPGQLPSQPGWTWSAGALVIGAPNNGRPATIPLDKMQ